jgi:arylformamidase
MFCYFELYHSSCFYVYHVYMISFLKTVGIFIIVVLVTYKSYGQDSVQSASIHLDIPYVRGGGHKQQLDLYIPVKEFYPVILFVHEGSLQSGDRKDEPYAQMCKVFQEQGIACAAMSYRLASEHKWPAQPNDVVAAFDWLKKNIPQYGGNANQIYLFGHSSGCTLVSIIGADPSYLGEKGYTQQEVAGIILMGCRLNNTLEVTTEKSEYYETYTIPPQYVDRYMERQNVFTSISQLNNAVPAKHVDENLPPTLVLVAEEERFFPPILRDGAEFVGRALAAGAKANLHILYNRTHMSAIKNMVVSDDMAVIKILEFIRDN